jgi:hypothetical protein
MPVRRVGKNCYQWGHHGKRYCGPGARQKAERQGRAAYSHGYRGREMREDLRQVTLYRASDYDTLPFGCAAFTEEIEVAKLYIDNPGFGGKNIYRTEVTVDEDKVLNLYNEDKPEKRLANLVDMDVWQFQGNADVAICADIKIQDQLRDQGYEWVLVLESYPQTTMTWLWIGPSDKEPWLNWMLDPKTEEWIDISEGAPESGLEENSGRELEEVTKRQSVDGKWVTMPLSRLVEIARATMGSIEWENNDMLAPELDPADVPDGVWVRYTHEWGREYTADGNHRIAGMLKWCETHDVDPSDVEIDVWISLEEPPNLSAPRAQNIGYDPNWWKQEPKRLTDTQLDVLRLIAEGREIGDYVPRYRPGAQRGRGAFPTTIAARAAAQLARMGLVEREARGGYVLTSAGAEALPGLHQVREMQESPIDEILDPEEVSWREPMTALVTHSEFAAPMSVGDVRSYRWIRGCAPRAMFLGHLFGVLPQSSWGKMTRQRWKEFAERETDSGYDFDILSRFMSPPDPLIVTIDNGRTTLRDGWHRAAYMILNDFECIPIFMGTH